MFEFFSILASPIYERCEILTLLFILDFLISTKFPILASLSILVSSRNRAKGPNETPSLITVFSIWQKPLISTSLPISTFEPK